MIWLILCQVAAAAPTSLAYQGRLLDPAGGPLNGEHELTVSLYEEMGSSQARYDETFAVRFDQGYFHVVVGAEGTLDSELLEDVGYLGMSVDGGIELSRQPVTAVPFAANAVHASASDTAGHALTADSASEADSASRSDVADRALAADRATSAGTADSASRSDVADRAGMADRATSAATADVADRALLADRATTAATADSSQRSDVADRATLADRATSAAEADFATTSATADRATSAASADHATSSGSAGTADTAVRAQTAGYADASARAQQADLATHALTAGSADTSTTSQRATSASTADYATASGTAEQAASATFATSSQTAQRANHATTADTATTASSATVATSVDGGTASVQSLRVAGALIVNTSGAMVAPVGWGQLTGVPASFADGSDADTLGGMACGNGQVVQRIGTTWGCADPFATPASVTAAVGGHAADASAHHPRFTAAEARAAVTVPTAGNDACPVGWDTYGDLCFYNSRRAVGNGGYVAHLCRSQLGGHLCTSMEVASIRGWRGWFGGNFWYADQSGDDYMLFHNANGGGYWYNHDGSAWLGDNRHAYCCRSR